MTLDDAKRVATALLDIGTNYSLLDSICSRLGKEFPEFSWTLLYENSSYSIQVDRSNACSDTELIECKRCGIVLNNRPLWVIGGTAEILCERCYEEKYSIE